MKQYHKLEDYGLIGNLETCALVSKEGSIDWMCLPHLESPSVFAKILDAEKGGNFEVQPAGKYKTSMEYIEHTNILQTDFSTVSGTAQLTDFMFGGKNPGLIRKLEGIKGRIKMKVMFNPVFNYARVPAKFSFNNSHFKAAGGGQTLFLKSDVPLRKEGTLLYSDFVLNEGDVYWFVLTHKTRAELTSIQCSNLLNDTREFWEKWVHKCELEKCVFGGEWHAHIIRSELVLKLLTHPSSGAIAAAPTTSLPEAIGGARNWDYRYCWIRDASFTLQALYNLGHLQEAQEFFEWIRDLRHFKKPSRLKVLYGLHKGLDLKEHKLKHLSGYEASAPVRIGNGAFNQTQIDIYGEIINAYYEINRRNETAVRDDWQFLRRVLDYVTKIWKKKDNGIWEVRGPKQHFVHSKLMCWVALDRGIKLAKQVSEKHSFIAKLEKALNQVKDSILINGYNPSLKSFTQYYGVDTVDAATLLIPIMGLLPYDDERVLGTISLIKKRLLKNGFVLRYEGNDGLQGAEGAFVLCTFWLIDVLLLSGNIGEGEKLFKNILKYVSPLGLLSEEVNPQTGELLGNFPQAFSHIGFINSALYLGMVKSHSIMGPLPVGVEETGEHK